MWNFSWTRGGGEFYSEKKSLVRPICGSKRVGVYFFSVSVFQEFIPKKSFEVVYALMRVARTTHGADFSGHLERVALDMMRSATLGNFLELRAFLKLTEYYLRIGEGNDLVSHFLVETIMKEMGELDQFVVEYMKEGDLDLKNNLEKEVASGFLVSKPKKIERSDGAHEKVSEPVSNQPEEVFFEEIPKESFELQSFLQNSRVDSVREAVPSKPSFSSFGASMHSNSGSETDVLSGNSAIIRQSAILGKIRQSSYCRLKDVQDLIPNSSERTLRYDLQKLIERGEIERVGSGGPSSFYRVRRDG